MDCFGQASAEGRKSGPKVRLSLTSWKNFFPVLKEDGQLFYFGVRLFSRGLLHQ